MNSLTRFEDVMSRCEELVTLYRRQPCKADDILRFVVTLSVAGFERYVKDRFVESIVPYMRTNAGKEPSDTFQNFLSNAEVDAAFWRTCSLSGVKRPLRKVRTKLQRHLEKTPVQKQESINELFKCFGMGAIIQNSIGKTRKSTFGSHWNV